MYAKTAGWVLLASVIFPSDIVQGQLDQSKPLKTSASAKLPEIKKLGQIQDKSIRECSGIAICRSHPNHFWMHNDSGDKATIFLVSKKGKTKSAIELKGVKAIDFEDIVSFGYRSKNFVAVADFGDNLRRRKNVVIYIVEEPSSEELRSKMKVNPVVTVACTYEGGTARDCEALAYLSSTGQFLVCSKPRASEVIQGQSAELFSIEFDWSKKKQDCIAKKVGSIAGGLITGMDCSSDGKQLVVRNYLYGCLWKLDESPSLMDLTDQRAIRVKLPLQRQSEAICFGEDGKSLYTTSEGKNQLLYEVSLD